MAHLHVINMANGQAWTETAQTVFNLGTFVDDKSDGGEAIKTCAVASASAAITKLARSAFPDLECRPPLRFVIWVMLFALHKKILHKKSLDQQMPLIVCLFDMGNVAASGKAFENPFKKPEVFFSSTREDCSRGAVQ